MNFYFHSIVLWLKNSKIRTLKFEPNRINMITGDSNTGKSAILEVIDYCLFASKHKISDSVINENVRWYGIKIGVNDKVFSIARKSPDRNQVSQEYFFSSDGFFPDGEPKTNSSDSQIKKALEVEFGINNFTQVSYGGRFIPASSKISLRYFLIFNSLSQDVITHSSDFFDLRDERYREALPRIFDIALGIDSVDNVLKTERRREIEREIRKLERENSRISDKKIEFESNLADIVRKAKEYSLIPLEENLQESLLSLENLSKRTRTEAVENSITKYEEIEREISSHKRKIQNLKSFSEEYSQYKANLKDIADSLRPVAYIDSHFGSVLKTSIYDGLISFLAEDLKQIKAAIVDKTPMDINIDELIRDHESKITDLSKKKKILPKKMDTFESEKEKFVFLGEIRGMLQILGKVPSENILKSTRAKIDDLSKELELLKVSPPETRRQQFVRVLDENIQEYIDIAKDALGNYGSYRSSFDYNGKRLHLKKPKTIAVENIGSSSNHMFLHLFLFLGLHEVMLTENVPHVPPYLIIDQFSRPYWGDQGEKLEMVDSDISKVRVALKLLDSFMQKANALGRQFQMIIFEHIPEDLWEPFPSFHLVEKFTDGNALIPREMIS